MDALVFLCVKTHTIEQYVQKMYAFIQIIVLIRSIVYKFFYKGIVTLFNMDASLKFQQNYSHSKQYNN